MARELGDVLHYFIAEPVAAPAPRPMPVVAVPVGERDVVRPAFLWNLAVELAREGTPATWIAPEREADPAAPDPGPGPFGATFAPSFAEDLEGLAETTRACAAPAAGPRAAGLVLVQVPAAWLEKAPEGHPLLAWTLLFTTPEPRDLGRAVGLALRLAETAPRSRIGVTVHGVRAIDEAREAFLGLADAFERRAGRTLCSYGLLLDDLDVYRAIVERRAIGVSRPGSRAARALRDVARLLREDAAGGHG